MLPDLRKYPRTDHLEGSRTQAGDENLEAVPLRTVAGARFVIEEKIDGANAAMRFDRAGRLHLQSRGHYLTGGPRERHFALFKQWAHAHAGALFAALGTRYVMYGEWLYAKHTIFYDRLPHYFLEFDLLDLDADRFLSTPRRREVLAGAPVVSVPVVQEGTVRTVKELNGLIGPSVFISDGHRERLRVQCVGRGLDPDRVARETDSSPTMEGLYLKAEADGEVRARYKFIRASFLQAVVESGDHWLDRPIVPNQLRPGVDIFAASLS